jgi:molybdate transport system substrate-binding protein
MPGRLIVAIVRLQAALLLGLPPAVNAADISVFSGGAVKAALSVAAAKFEQTSGHRVIVDYAPVGTLMQRLAAGEMPDVVVLTTDVIAQAETKGWAVPGTAITLGRVGVGVAVQELATAPDISTPEALKRALLAAKSITYIDPEKGTSGKHFAEVLDRLGIADAVKAKTTLGDGGYVVEAVARGDIDLGIQQITEILPVQGAKLVGPLPEALQKITEYTAASTPRARNVKATGEFLAYLGSSAVHDIFSDKGFLVP